MQLPLNRLSSALQFCWRHAGGPGNRVRQPRLASDRGTAYWCHPSRVTPAPFPLQYKPGAAAGAVAGHLSQGLAKPDELYS